MTPCSPRKWQGEFLEVKELITEPIKIVEYCRLQRLKTKNCQTCPFNYILPPNIGYYASFKIGSLMVPWPMCGLFRDPVLLDLFKNKWVKRPVSWRIHNNELYYAYNTTKSTVKYPKFKHEYVIKKKAFEAIMRYQ